MRTWRRLLSMLLCAALLTGALTGVSFAAEIVDSGECGDQGDNVTWTLDSEGTLVISGTGAIGDGFFVDYWPEASFLWDLGINSDEINGVIESGITSIDGMAFLGDRVLNCSIPASITSIGSDAFSGCGRITVDPQNPVFSSQDGVLFSKDKDVLYHCPSNKIGSYSIPSSVKVVSDYAFWWCEGLSQITIPKSVVSIKEAAFMDCYNITSITIPSTVNEIGSRAFEACINLTAVKIPDSVNSIGQDTFSGCRGLESVEISKNVKSIGGGAFSGCKRLTTITLPDSITSISGREIETWDQYAEGVAEGVWFTSGTFEGCTSLTSVTIPASVTSIGEYAFYGCSSLTDVYYAGTEAQWKAITIGSNNAPLLNATIHYGSSGGGEENYGIVILYKPSYGYDGMPLVRILKEDNKYYDYYVASYNGRMLQGNTSISISISTDTLVRFEDLGDNRIAVYSANYANASAVYSDAEYLYYNKKTGMWDGYTSGSIPSSHFDPAHAVVFVSYGEPLNMLGTSVNRWYAYRSGQFSPSGYYDETYPSAVKKAHDQVVASTDLNGEKKLKAAAVFFDAYQPPCSISELTSIDYLAFASIAYWDDWTPGITIREKIGGLWNSKWDETEIKYKELFDHIQNWKCVNEFNDNDSSGYVAVVFENTQKEAVIAFAGTQDIPGPDAGTDLDLYFNKANEQMVHAFNTYENVKSLGYKTIATAGHSLGGTLATVISAYADCYGETYNAGSFLDTAYLNYPEQMMKSFSGMEEWKCYDHINEKDTAIGMDEYEHKNHYMHKDEGLGHGYFGVNALRPHSLTSFIKKSNNGNLILTPSEKKQTHKTVWLGFGYSGVIFGFTDSQHIYAPKDSWNYTIYGGDGSDEIIGNTGNNVIIGGKNDDYLDGGYGNDTYYYRKRG